MRMCEPLTFLPHMTFNGHHIDPSVTVPCPVCKTKFVLAEGMAFPASVAGEMTIGFFCEASCVLKAYPDENYAWVH